MSAQHVPNVTAAQTEVVQKALVEIGETVRCEAIAKRHTKGSEPSSQLIKTRGKRPVRPFGGEVEVKIEDPIVRAHGYLPFSRHEKTNPSAGADR